MMASKRATSDKRPKPACHSVTSTDVGDINDTGCRVICVLATSTVLVRDGPTTNDDDLLVELKSNNETCKQ
jgi:hypothetical protein